MKRIILGGLLIGILLLVLGLGFDREVVFTEAGQELATSLGYAGKAEDFNGYIEGLVSKVSASKEVYSDEVKSAMQVRFYQQHKGELIQEVTLFTNNLMGNLASLVVLLVKVLLKIFVGVLVIIGCLGVIRLLTGKDSLEDYKKELHNK